MKILMIDNKWQCDNYKNQNTGKYTSIHMLIELDNIVHCLRGLQQQDSQDFNDQLTEICLNPAVLMNFKTILADPHIQQPTKKMAAVFFKNYFIQRYTDFEEVFFIELVMSIVLDEKLPYKYKIILEQTIISMLEWIEKLENLQQVIDCIQTVFCTLEKVVGKESLSLQKKLIKKNRNLDPTRLDLKKYCKFNIQNEDEFLNLGFSIVHFIECFTSTNAIDTQDLHRVVRTSLQPSLQIFGIKNSQQHLRLQMVILHMWLGYIQLIESQREQKKQMRVIEQEIFQERLLWNKIIEVYEFAAFSFVPIENQDLLLVCSPEQPHKKLINKMKNYACQIHLKLLKFETEETQRLGILNETIAPAMFARIIKTLSYFSLHKPMMYSTFSEQFINSLLTVFIYISKQSPQIIDSNWANLLHMIIFPLLTIDEKEFQSFDDEPEEFCRLAEDCCDKQNLGEIKTEAARFLEVVCDRSPTFAKYVFQYCCVSLQTAIYKNQSNIDATQTILLSVQTSFMVMSILSYYLGQFQFERSSIQKILLAPQCFKLTEIEASRVFLFLSYNYTEIFPDPLKGKVWINYAMSGNMHYTTKKTAFDFILNTVDQYFEEEFLVEFSAKLNSQVEIRQIWGVINKLLNNHLQKVSQTTMLKLIQNILERMSSEITKYNNKQIKSTQNINSGLELMRKILSNHKYTSNKPQVLAQIYKVVPLYKTFKKLHLEDVILKIINEFMDKQDRISQIFDNMLVQLIEEFRSQGYRPTAFFWIWNQYVFKSQSFEKIRQIEGVLMEGLHFFKQTFLKEKRRTQNNLPIAHIFLILQHILMIHGQKMSKDEIFNIYQLSKMFLPQDMDEPQKINLSPTIIGRALIVMLICHMLKKNQSRGDQKIDALNYLLLYHDEEDVFTGQNTEVLVKLLCKELFRESDPISVTEMINIMVRVLRPTPKEITHRTKTKKVAKNSLHFKIKAKQNFEMILKKVKSPFDFKVSAEQQLRNSLSKMKQNNELLYKSIMSHLPKQIIEKLRDLLSTKSFVSTQIEKTRKIFKVGGVKQGKVERHDDQETQTISKKRMVNFNANEQDQIYEEIDENELILENEKHQSDEVQELKGKMKKSKFMKKLKKNEKQFPS